MEIPPAAPTSGSPDVGSTMSDNGSSSQSSSCQCQQKNRTERYVYALGKLELKFPSLALEREFQQRERQLLHNSGTPITRRGDRLRAVLKANSHLARSVCYVFSINGMPTYSVIPTGSEILASLLDALPRIEDPNGWDLVIGRGGPMADPTACGGALVQSLACDAFYSFSLDELFAELAKRSEPVLKSHKGKANFAEVARDFFLRVALSIENTGALDTHRALNYLLVQHPGPFIAALQHADESILDSIESRFEQSLGGRKIVTVILTFLNRATGVPQRLFTRIDVTEEWPFLVDSLHGGAATLAMAPFVDSGALGSFV